MNKIIMILLSLLVVVGLVLSSCSAVDPQEISDQVEAGEVAFIAVTGRNDYEQDLQEAGIPYLIKPFGRDSLLTTIEKQLHKE